MRSTPLTRPRSRATTSRLLTAAAAALLAALAFSGAAAGSTMCGRGGATAYAKQGVRLYSVRTTAKGKARIRLFACSTVNPRPKSLAYGPPSLVKFGAFHTTGRYVGWEVIGVQSSAGAAGAGTNYNIGWVNARSGLIRMNFLFVSTTWPPHRYAIDPASGSLAMLVGATGKAQTLFEADYDPFLKDFSGHDLHQLDGAWNIPHIVGGGKIIPATLVFVDGKIRYRTSDGRSVTIDPADA